MVATPLPMLPSWRTPRRQRQERRLERDRRRRDAGQADVLRERRDARLPAIAQDPAERSTAIIRPRRDPDRDELIELGAQALDQEGRPRLRPCSDGHARGHAPRGGRRRVAASRARASSSRSRPGISRVIDLVREIAQAAVFGISGPINAFEIAFLIPNTGARRARGRLGAVGGVRPVFSDLLVKGASGSAPGGSASTLFWLMLLGLGGMTALFIVIAPLGHARSSATA